MPLKKLAPALSLATAATLSASAPAVASTSLEAEAMSLPAGASVYAQGGASGGKGVVFRRNGTAGVQGTMAAFKRLSVRAQGDQCAGAPRLVVRVDGVRRLSKGVTSRSARTYSAAVAVSAGRHRISVSFTNDFQRGGCNRNLRVDKVSLSGSRAIPHASRRGPKGAAPNWQLTFSDEFDGSALDASKWNSSDFGATGFSKPTHFLPEQLSVGSGRLRITAQPKATPSGRPYASGLINTRSGKFSQTYGRFEARMRIPRGRALWPAFWLMPSSGAWPPELDIMEMIGQEPTKVYQTYHYKDASGAHRQFQCKPVGGDYSLDYHTFAVEWSPGLIVWKVDGAERCRTTTGVHDGPMYAIVNLSVGHSGSNTDWVGMPDSSTSFPAHLDVDWVRAYRRG